MAFISSLPWTIKRCAALNFGWHEVSVIIASVGFTPGLSGTGAITDIFQGATISEAVISYTK